VIVGGAHDLEPDYERYLRQAIADLGLRDHVTLAGLQRNVPQWMAAMDVVVHASDREPFGIVIIEAMALAKPVVATNAAGPTEIITPNVSGQLTAYGDAAALAAAILRYLDNPPFAATIAAAARRRALEFSTQSYARKLTAMLLELCPAIPNPSPERQRRASSPRQNAQPGANAPGLGSGFQLAGAS
jgi:glycosyltransferase involved in cell wall biosynthesis